MRYHDYDGWKIRTHKRKIPEAERQRHWCSIKNLFKAENVDFSDNDYKFTVYDGLYQFNVRGSFPDKNEYGYRMELKSQVLGCKSDERKAHQALYYTTIAKIRWEKQGFWLEGDYEIPIPKPKVLRETHRHISQKSSARLLQEIIKKPSRSPPPMTHNRYAKPTTVRNDDSAHSIHLKNKPRN